ncbi:MAG: DUF4105 domain-containing protein [Bacteroidota bacterium]
MAATKSADISISMVRYLLTLFLLISCCAIGNSQGFPLSPNAEIRVLTCGPYQGELYSAFGHSAIRVVDPARNFDRIYNYGIFDFDQPNFYANFAKGYLNYKLGVSDYKWFRDYYIYYDRFIHEQVLNFDQNQKQRFFDFLQWNSLPENQYYFYDYFYDNCATRVRDALKRVFKDSIQFDGSYVQTDYTIRELTDLYLDQQPWGDFGIDLALGLPMDKKATPEMYMFLPDYIESAFNNATIIRDGEKVPLVARTEVTYESRNPAEKGFNLLKPLYVFWFIFLLTLVLTYFNWKKNKTSRVYDGILFSFVGLVGWVLFLLWVATDHNAAAKNFNLLWAIPLHFPFGLFLFKKKVPSFLSTYFTIVTGITVLLIVSWFFLPQKMHYSLFPMALALGLRSFYNFRYIKSSRT